MWRPLEEDWRKTPGRVSLRRQVRYSGYLQRQSMEIERRRSNENLSIPEGIDYEDIRGLSAEVREKLAIVRPVDRWAGLKNSGNDPCGGFAPDGAPEKTPVSTGRLKHSIRGFPDAVHDEIHTAWRESRIANA